MSFTAIVVLHDSERHLHALLESIDRRLPERPQLICVDSGSRDGGAQLSRDWGAEVLVLDGNPGFGAANNAGIALACHDVTVLLNPDCVAIDDGLARLAREAAGTRALLAPRLLNDDRSLQRSAHPLPGTRGGYLAALVPPRLLPRATMTRLEPFRATEPQLAGWAIAACIAAPTALLRELGPFDPSAFLFYEDLELCLRARARGVPTLLVPSVALVHSGQHATSAAYAREPLELQARRRRQVVGALLGPRARARDDRAQALTFGLRTLAGRRSGRNRAQLAAVRRARREP